MRIVQFRNEDGNRRVARVDDSGDRLVPLTGMETVYALAQDAMATGKALEALVADRATDSAVDYDAVIESGRLLPPIDHPDAAHLLVTGTGLTHLGSADARDKMHQNSQAAEEDLSDSMVMFKWGVEGGKPAGGGVGVQPEWFYKGDGSIVVAPEQAFTMPEFAEDGGEEPEICGLYVIAPDGTPRRVGFALGNEFSDHVMERRNYLYLAHSKLRQCAYGPELLLGDLPRDIQGVSKITRDGTTRWEKPFVTGEDNMSHTLFNLEYHHFKYPLFRRPGDVHCHFFGTATLSVADGIKVDPGDVFEISAPAFGRPLRNGLAVAEAGACEVKPL